MFAVRRFPRPRHPYLAPHPALSTGFLCLLRAGHATQRLPHSPRDCPATRELDGFLRPEPFAILETCLETFEKRRLPRASWLRAAVRSRVRTANHRFALADLAKSARAGAPGPDFRKHWRRAPTLPGSAIANRSIYSCLFVWRRPPRCAVEWSGAIFGRRPDYPICRRNY